MYWWGGSREGSPSVCRQLIGCSPQVQRSLVQIAAGGVQSQTTSLCWGGENTLAHGLDGASSRARARTHRTLFCETNAAAVFIAHVTSPDEHALTLRRHIFTHGPMNPSAAWKAFPPDRTFTQQVGTGRPGGVRVSVQAGRPLLDTRPGPVTTHSVWTVDYRIVSLRLSKKKKKDTFFWSNSNMYALFSPNVSTLLPSSLLGFPLFRVQILPQMAHRENVLCGCTGMLPCRKKM